MWGPTLKDAFKKGEYRGTLDEVKSNIAKYGAPEVCTYHKGWFDDTMPSFKQPICAAYIDVDLASSTKTCLENLFPLLVPGGALFSQDGHIPLVVDVLRDDAFWRDKIGCPTPRMKGLGTDSLVTIYK
jgi:O-methyltransferase